MKALEFKKKGKKESLKNRKRLSGEVVVFLSLLLVVLVSFVTTVIGGMLIQISKNTKRADMDRAMECVFAEYQKELFDVYDIFAIEGSYETGDYEEELIFDRLDYYGASDMGQELERIQFLTDQNGTPFLEQMANVVKHNTGIDRAEELLGISDIWKTQEEGISEYQWDSKQSEDTISQMLSESEEILPTTDNPIAHMDGLKSRSLLELVTPKDYIISNRQISVVNCVSRRSLNHGYGDFSDQMENGGAISNILVGSYLLDHFGCAVEEGKYALSYELEYILSGEESDEENLEKVLSKLLLIRLVPNYAYLQTDETKKAQARSAALALCSVLTVPGISEAVAQGILFAWAYGESIVDLRSLLKGNRVPLVKDSGSWQLSLGGLLQLGEGQDVTEGRDDLGGLKYQDFLRILLFLEKRDQLALRTLDLIETNINQMTGADFFRADQCICRMEVNSTSHLKRGITYSFPTYFGYQ